MTDDFTRLPDLASRLLGGAVVAANDELFAEKENLIKPGPAEASAEFGHKGKVYDGWETRRRRDLGPDAHDWAIVRLGVPGVVRGVVVDTAFFTGNFPPYCSVEGALVEGYPAPSDITGWMPLLGRSDLEGDTVNPFDVTSDERVTHVRLNIFPDGGVARFRVHGEPRPDPRLLTGTIDLAALENGGAVVDCSDMFYSSPTNLLLPGRARSMGEGWENARRRDHGHDHVTVRLAGRGVVRRVEIDTSYFVGNAPGWASVTAGSHHLVPKTALQPDTRHVFVVEEQAAVSEVRLDVFPDGGVARFRVWGELV
ncbi:MAG TPA: allantoicase [Nocardioidaceae bacterium]|nr:allantoicase [Nocardioidaceae bacterium]